MLQPGWEAMVYGLMALKMVNQPGEPEYYSMHFRARDLHSDSLIRTIKHEMAS